MQNSELTLPVMDTAKFFDENIKESIGCTEPAAVALAVAAAFNALKGRLPDDYPGQSLDLSPQEVSQEIEQITVRTDRDVFKNALQVGIPHECGGRGISKAAALGVFCNPGKGLELFSDLDGEKSLEAAGLLKAGKVEITPVYDWSGLRIEAEVKTRTGTGVAHVLNEHSNITHIVVNGQTKFENHGAEQSLEVLSKLHRLDDFIEIIENGLGPQAVKTIENAIIIDHKASLIAERRFIDLHQHSFGLSIRSFVRGGYLCEDSMVLAKEKVSLLVEARMTGFDIKVATCAGSGNMGVVATLPVVAMALYEFAKQHPDCDVNWESVIAVIREKAPEDWAKLVRAVGLVHLIANYTSLCSGKLSASCGCGTKAGVGVAAGIAYYLIPSDDRNRVSILGEAINVMARGIIGMICDGGKEGCALKTATATGVAIESALFACRGLSLSRSDGIADMDAVVTLKNIGMLSNATVDIDRKILELAREGIARRFAG